MKEKVVLQTHPSIIQIPFPPPPFFLPSLGGGITFPLSPLLSLLLDHSSLSTLTHSTNQLNKEKRKKPKSKLEGRGEEGEEEEEEEGEQEEGERKEGGGE